MNISIRHAKKQDIPTLADFSHKLNETQTDAHRPDEKALLNNWDRFSAYLIFDDDLGIGYCMGCKIFHPHMGYIRFEIQAIFIDPNYRSQGLGEKLMRYAIHDQAQKGVKWFSLQALIKNEKASAFYESLGFEKRPNNFNRYYLWQDKLDKFLG